MAAEHAMFFENRRGLQLFGVYHEADVRPIPRLGVVLCHPLGDAKDFSYRAYVEFARALTSVGHPTLRYDGGGFGDSQGESVDVTLESLREDTLDAICKLGELANVTQFALIGCQFGAALAALAAVADERVRALGLISPIVSGKRYRDRLFRTHQMSALAQGRRSLNRHQLLEHVAKGGALEIDAQLVSAVFLEQIAAIDLLRDTSSFVESTIVATPIANSPERNDVLQLIDTYRQAGRKVLDRRHERDFWTRESLYEGYLPVELYARTTEWLAEIRA